MCGAYLMYLIINIIFVTDWLEEMDDDDRMEFEGKLSLVRCSFSTLARTYYDDKRPIPDCRLFTGVSTI